MLLWSVLPLLFNGIFGVGVAAPLAVSLVGLWWACHPAKTKAKAVFDTLCGPIGEACPATILRRHESAKLYLDADSSALL